MELFKLKEINLDEYRIELSFDSAICPWLADGDFLFVIDRMIKTANQTANVLIPDPIPFYSEERKVEAEKRLKTICDEINNNSDKI